MFKELRGLAKSRISGFILIGGLVFAFGLWGVGDIFRGAISDAVAEVGDTEITGVQLSRELQARMRAMGQQMNTNFTMEQARQFGMDEIVLQELLSSAALNEVAGDLGLTASNDMVLEAIQAQPAFQGLNGLQIIQTLNSSGYTEQAYVDEIHSFGQVGKRFYAECTPGYYNGEGKGMNKNGFFSDMYGAGATAFFQKLEDWREEGGMKGLDIT